MSKSKKDERLGELLISNQGFPMKIVEYNNTDSVIVEFQDEYKYRVHTGYRSFKKGIVRNHFEKCASGVGYVGNVNVCDSNCVQKLSYTTWLSMIGRCYNERLLKKRRCYKDIYVCDEWLCYENFEKWYDENYWLCGNERMTLDKDILIKGNKTYSSEGCIIVPNRINQLFAKSKNSRGDLPIGVVLIRETGYYRAQCSYIPNNKTKRICKNVGHFKTIPEAFNAYKDFKEKYIKQVANDYKSKYPNFPTKLYDAMYNYEVEITD